MHDRSALGPADVSDTELTSLVAQAFDLEPAQVELVESSAQTAPYDLEALTTAGRYWVRGCARVAGRRRQFTFFVKVVQSWARSPSFAVVPADFRESALVMLPWRTEPAIYRSDLAERLPSGLEMAKAYAVIDVDDESAAIWLEAVDYVTTGWDDAMFGRAAYLLGRLAASERVRPLTAIGRSADARAVRGYAGGRVAHQVLPAPSDDRTWLHPLVAGAFDDRLRTDLRIAAGDLWSLVDELERMPVGTAHGDACTRNLLVRPGSEAFVLIDYGFWGCAPLGADLSQLLLGEVQVGDRPASTLPRLAAACLPAYIRGLRSEGCEVDEGLVRRSHALWMLLFSGLSALPSEHLDGAATPERHRIAAERARMARFILDLVYEPAPASLS